jgi:dTDP-L-rhamnose 4-epimerase
MRRVLITGGAGFIGTGLTRALVRRGWEVVVLDPLTEQVHAGRPWEGPAEAALVRGDVLDRRLLGRWLAGVTHVVHLAAETGVGQSMYEIARYVEVNSLGTAVLMEELARCGTRIEKIVLASSRAVYGEGRYSCQRCGVVTPLGRRISDPEREGWSPVCPVCQAEISPMPADEDQPPRPVSTYAVTKLSQEHLLAQFCLATGIPCVSLRLQNVYGPGQSLENPYTGILSIFSTRALAGHPLSIYEDGRQLRDFVYIDDTVGAICCALDGWGTGLQTLNVGSGAPTSILDVATLLVEALGVDVPIRVTGQWRAGDIRHAWADLARIRRAYGFAPAVSLREGLQRFAAWVRQQPLAGDRFGKMEEELREKGLLLDRVPA